MTRGIVSASLFALAGCAILCGLGTWQLERLAWKNKLIEDLDFRLAAAPQPLPAAPSQANDEFRRVRLRVQLPANDAAFVYTAGSALRPDISGPGYWIMAPGKTERGTIVINRGFILPDRRGAAVPGGEMEIVGALRWPEEGGAFTPADDPKANVWYRRDPAVMAAAKGWGPVASYYIEQEAPQQNGAPKAGPLIVKLTNNHLQYAITWFGLAAALAGVYLVWLWSRLRRGRA